MIREDRFVLSRRQYAVDLTSLKVDSYQPKEMEPYASAQVSALWFRRRRGITVACVGYLRDYQQHKPVTADAFLVAHDDGRYGGKCRGRWDGARYWGHEDLEVQSEHLALLRPMVESIRDNPCDPALPTGYDGWWRF